MSVVTVVRLLGAVSPVRWRHWDPISQMRSQRCRKTGARRRLRAGRCKPSTRVSAGSSLNTLSLDREVLFWVVASSLSGDIPEFNASGRGGGSIAFAPASWASLPTSCLLLPWEEVVCNLERVLSTGATGGLRSRCWVLGRSCRCGLVSEYHTPSFKCPYCFLFAFLYFTLHLYANWGKVFSGLPSRYWLVSLSGTLGGWE